MLGTIRPKHVIRVCPLSSLHFLHPRNNYYYRRCHCSGHLASELMTRLQLTKQETKTPPVLTILHPTQISSSLRSQLRTEIETLNLPAPCFCSPLSGFIIHFSEFIRIFISLVVPVLINEIFLQRHFSFSSENIFKFIKIIFLRRPNSSFSIPSFF